MNKRVIPKEWKCVSGAFKGIYYALYVVGALCMVPLISAVLVGSVFTSLNGWFMLLIYAILFGGMFYWLGPEHKTKANLKRVLFLPNYFYIDKYRMHYYMIESIEFSEIYKGGRGDLVLGFLFKLELKTNTRAGKTILFAMDFSVSALKPQNDYDYQRNFIDVVMQWAHDDVKPPSQYAF